MACRPSKKTAGPICRRVQLQNSTVGVAVWEDEDGLAVVDQSGRFLPKVPSSEILPPSNRRRTDVAWGNLVVQHASVDQLNLETGVMRMVARSSGD